MAPRNQKMQNASTHPLSKKDNKEPNSTQRKNSDTQKDNEIKYLSKELGEHSEIDGGYNPENAIINRNSKTFDL
eukprot:13561327-Ditylum_brightwellii.AAC.1